MTTFLQPASAYLEARQLTKRFDGVAAVDAVSLSIAQGEIFALLGSSGCGKSTLLRMLAGFEVPTSGQVVLSGQDITALPPYERPINMMFQSYALFPHLSVADNIAFGLKREGMPASQIAVRVGEMLDLVQMQAYALRKPHQLSGGQQQRVALARSLAKRPRLLLLDEPLGALDKKLREQTQFELVNIIRSVGVTVVMVTHDQEEAMTMASRIAVMNQGRVLQVGTPLAIYETPQSRFVADFIGHVNVFEGRLSQLGPDGAVVAVADGAVRLAPGTVPAGCGVGAALALAVRPEKIQLARCAPEGVSCNVFSATVREVAYFGSYSRYGLETASGLRVRVTQSNTSRQAAQGLEPQTPVVLWFDGAAPVALLA
jgi:putrescine transport system ATP-binding protein